MKLNDGGNEVMVSIVLTVFNHEKYIARALKSIINQETTFRYEILVGDDASTDNSISVIMEYSRLYSDVVIPVLRKANIGGSKNFTDLLRRCRGRYIAFIDGDDFWVDSRKLQIQYDYLEKNSDAFCVSHKVRVCNADEEFLYTAPRRRFNNNKITIKDFLKGYRFPLTATMMRAIHGQDLDKLIHLIDAGPRNEGDTTICLYLLNMGPIPILDKEMTVYRYRSTVGHDNYNSITKLPEKIQDKIKLIGINDRYYSGKYYFGWLYIWLAAKAARSLFKSNTNSTIKILSLITRIALLFTTSSANYIYRKAMC